MPSSESAVDANRAGDRYADRHAELARAAGIRFGRLRPPEGLDWNEVLKREGRSMRHSRAWVLLPSRRRLNLWRRIRRVWTDRDLAIGLSPAPIDGPAIRPGRTRSPWRSTV